MGVSSWELLQGQASSDKPQVPHALQVATDFIVHWLLVVYKIDR
ncbi:hypothetical protein M23134_04049 [Microscilla marina ATCC 23134]|uniref:Uncharacterized protein n=1 Tax=Microscilla marina ATCC 23134 TaxID=313606 RepID=A1ZDQ8_MICM2|nr:hypothetical protein M23134_04049 [Microscilla marina ATCC 23134]